MRMNVIGFGALNLDKLYRVRRIAKAGEESFIYNYDEASGGSAANTIVGLSRLGVRVGYIGKVGNDREGEILLQSLKDENVDTRCVVASREGRSGAVIGFIDERGERALYVDPGVNDTLGFEEIDRVCSRETEFLHITSFVGDKPFEAQKKLLREFSEVKVSFDPGELYARRGFEGLEPIIHRSFVILPNENEIRLLTGEDYRKGAKILINEGAQVVAVKLGDRGCFVTDGREDHLINAYEANVVDTTGAGDAFCAGFLYGIVKGKDLYTCGRLGNFVASRKIGKIGARQGLPKLSDFSSSDFHISS